MCFNEFGKYLAGGVVDFDKLANEPSISSLIGLFKERFVDIESRIDYAYTFLNTFAYGIPYNVAYQRSSYIVNVGDVYYEDIYHSRAIAIAAMIWHCKHHEMLEDEYKKMNRYSKYLVVFRNDDEINLSNFDNDDIGFQEIYDAFGDKVFDDYNKNNLPDNIEISPNEAAYIRELLSKHDGYDTDLYRKLLNH